VQGSDYWGGPAIIVLLLFLFAADGSCDRLASPPNDRRVCRFIIIGAITNIISLAAGLRVWWWTTRFVIENIFTHMQGKTRLQAAN